MIKPCRPAKPEMKPNIGLLLKSNSSADFLCAAEIPEFNRLNPPLQNLISKRYEIGKPNLFEAERLNVIFIPVVKWDFLQNCRIPTLY